MTISGIHDSAQKKLFSSRLSIGGIVKRFVAIAEGRVQGVGYREHVYNETFETNITGYIKNWILAR